MIMYKPKKSLGQNFLKSILALKKIVEAGEVSEGNIILEIGPGKGVLTEKLLEKSGHVIAVEKDRELFELLKKKFEKEITEKKLILINEDILNIEGQDVLLGTLGSRKCAGDTFLNGDGQKKFSGEFWSGHKKNILSEYKIIANIPYNITGAILKKFLTEKKQPEMMVLMVQNEVAKRIVARDGKESILSISVKAYGEPKMIMKVPARYFSPAPNVDSAVIVIKNISRKIFYENNIDEKRFWEIIRTGFAHKRKKLSSNLKKIKNYTGNPYVSALENKRAEELTLTDWINLAKAIDINKKE
jgi:16S rRNA (adenine1518-N6/adenine1519-N6)-dimethyltransferase